MADRSKDWLEQALRDLESAQWEMRGGFHEWACFVSQQAAEKALKGLYHKFGGEAWGHSIVNLLEGLREKMNIEEGLFEAGRILDRYYIPARYPNGWETGIPRDYYTEKDSKDAITHSEKIIRFCQSLLA